MKPLAPLTRTRLVASMTERRVGGVARADHHRLHGPGDPHARIVPHKTACETRRIARRDHIQNLAAIGQGQKAMREALWRQERAAIRGREPPPEPPAVRRRAAANINDDVKNGSGRATYQFVLLVGRSL